MFLVSAAFLIVLSAPVLVCAYVFSNPRAVSEDTDEIGSDTLSEFRQAAEAILVVDARGSAEDHRALLATNAGS